jgi:hypothetical protein
MIVAFAIDDLDSFLNVTDKVKSAFHPVPINA